MCTHTHIFTKWGHWIIREMKKKKESQPTQTVISIISIQLAVWLLSLEGYGLSSPQSPLGLSHEEPVCHLIPLHTGSHARSHHFAVSPSHLSRYMWQLSGPGKNNSFKAFIHWFYEGWWIVDIFHSELVMLRPTMASSQANCIAFLVSSRLHCDMTNRDVWMKQTPLHPSLPLLNPPRYLLDAFSPGPVSLATEPSRETQEALSRPVYVCVLFICFPVETHAGTLSSMSLPQEHNS